MATRIERFVTGPRALKLATSIARATPPKLGYPIANGVAAWISSQRNAEMVRAVRSNQWVVAGEKISSQDLDQAVRAVYRNTARSIYELYHYIQNTGEVGQLFCIEPSFQKIFDRPEFDRSGLVIGGLHMAGFDLGLQWLCLNHFKPLVMTMPNPEGGRQLEFETRQEAGVNLALGSFTGIRQAIRHLQKGGMVVTGIDHPVPGSDSRPRFFSRPADLPIHHVYLALKMHVPVVIALSCLEEDGKYHIFASPAIEMDTYPNRADELRINAEKVLHVAEGFIRQAALQWLIYQPVWPESMAEVPK